MTAERVLDDEPIAPGFVAREALRFEGEEPAQLPQRRRRRDRLLRILTAPIRWPWGWWTALEPAERLMYRGLVMLAGGLAMVWPPLAMIVPGTVLTAAAFGFTFNRRGASDG